MDTRVFQLCGGRSVIPQNDENRLARSTTDMGRCSRLSQSLCFRFSHAHCPSLGAEFGAHNFPGTGGDGDGCVDSAEFCVCVTVLGGGHRTELVAKRGGIRSTVFRP
jgi:hypothetical protein